MRSRHGPPIDRSSSESPPHPSPTPRPHHFQPRVQRRHFLKSQRPTRTSPLWRRASKERRHTLESCLAHLDVGLIDDISRGPQTSGTSGEKASDSKMADAGSIGVNLWPHPRNRFEVMIIAALKTADPSGIRHEERDRTEHQDRQGKEAHERHTSATAETEAARKSRA